MAEQSLFGGSAGSGGDKASASDVVVFDLETQKQFADVGTRDKPHLLKVSVLGAYSYNEGRFSSFTEERLSEFKEMLGGTRRLVGFNIRHFDIPVLGPYFEFDWNGLEVFDIFEHVYRRLGHRLSLNSIAQATLKAKKSADGLEAIRMFREGRMDELVKYCLDDVKLTKDIYEFGRDNGYLLYKSLDGVDDLKVEVDFGERS